VPNDVFADLHRIQNPNQPPVNRVDLSVSMQSQLAARNEFSQFKEEVANMMRNKHNVDMGITRLYQKPTWLSPLVGVCLILLNIVVMATTQPGNILANTLLN
jgi:hypothetical protein